MSARSRRCAVLAGATAVGLATLIRQRPLPDVFATAPPQLLSGDAYYHLRRMAWAASHGLALPGHDAWLHAPRGMTAHWPPLFDVAGGALAWLAGGGPHALARVAAAGLVLTAASVAAGFAVVFVAARRLAGTTAGVLAVALLALHAGHHNYTQAGKLDHHVLEPLLSTLAVTALLRAADRPGRRRAVAGAVATLALLGLLLALPSSALPVALVAGAALVRLLLAPPPAGVLALPFLGAGAAALPFAWASPAGRAGLTIAWDLSPFQPVLAVLLGGGLLAAGLVSAARPPAGTVRRVGAAAAVVGLALAVWPAGRAALAGGRGFVEAQGFVALIDESASALAIGPARALVFLSPLALLVPVLGWAALRRMRATGDAAWGTWGALLVAMAVLALVQVRFVVAFAPVLAIVAGALLAVWLAAPRPSWQRIGALGAVALAAVPALPTLFAPPPALAARTPVRAAIAWLATATPSPGDPWDAASRPAWSVLAPWSYGHELLVLGGQANVASPFIAPGETAGHADVLTFLLAQDAADAEAVLDRHAVRWVLTTPVDAAALRRWALVLGRAGDALATPTPQGLAPTPDALRTAAVHLHEGNGSAGREVREGWGFLRLAWTAPDGDAKVFECVAGARLAGEAAPGADVVVRVDLDVGGTPTPWFAHAVAGAGGRWTIRVPWSTDAIAPGNVRVVRMRLGGGVPPRDVAVPEAAVRSGLEVPL